MTTPHLTHRQRLVADTLRSVEPISTGEMAAMVGLKQQTIISIMERLVELGLAHAKMDTTGAHRKNTRIYFCGTNPNPYEADKSPMKRVWLQSWKPNHRRDSLVEALFGPAQHAEASHG